MYKFAISYYSMDGNVRKPQSGVEVRILRPGQSWLDGMKLIETTPNSGYYEIAIESEAKCGFYEIWDNLGSPNGKFSGKTCTIGKLDARGLQNNCIYTNHILDGAVTATKIAKEAIGEEHLQDQLLTLSKLQHEIQDQKQGVGDITQASPASFGKDKVITHVLDREYKIVPHIVLNSYCDAILYISDIKTEGDMITVQIGIGQVFSATEPAYKLIALAF